jgi:hypothetical protein
MHSESASARVQRSVANTKAESGKCRRSSHAAARLRLRAGERRPRHAGNPRLAGSSVNPAYGALHRAGADGRCATFAIRLQANRLQLSHHRWNTIDFKALRRWLLLKCSCWNKPSKTEVCLATLPQSSPSDSWSDPGYFQPYRPRGREIAIAH